VEHDVDALAAGDVVDAIPDAGRERAGKDGPETAVYAEGEAGEDGVVDLGFSKRGERGGGVVDSRDTRRQHGR
jgi:hypothetical protein